jgi:hypothetical protein
VVEPEQLDRARLELWVTDKGSLAVGIEKRGRIAERIGARTQSSGFIGGHEPKVVPVAMLEALVNAIANGALTVRARRAFGHLLATTVDLQTTQSDSDGFRKYVKSIQIGDSFPLGIVPNLAYKPW